MLKLGALGVTLDSNNLGVRCRVPQRGCRGPTGHSWTAPGRCKV